MLISECAMQVCYKSSADTWRSADLIVVPIQGIIAGAVGALLSALVAYES